MVTSSQLATRRKQLEEIALRNEQGGGGGGYYGGAGTREQWIEDQLRPLRFQMETEQAAPAPAPEAPATPEPEPAAAAPSMQALSSAPADPGAGWIEKSTSLLAPELGKRTGAGRSSLRALATAGGSLY